MSDHPAPMPTKPRTPRVPAASGPATGHAVAETMRRVHEQLRHGSAPSFEALLAFGEPVHAPRVSG